jgi:hypothetical protein
VQEILQCQEELVANLSQVAKMIDEKSSRLWVPDGHFPRNFEWARIWHTRSKLFIVDRGPVNLHWVALKVQSRIIHNIVPNQRSQEIPQILAVARGSGVVAEQLCPEKVSTKIFLECLTPLDIFLD